MKIFCMIALTMFLHIPCFGQKPKADNNKLTELFQVDQAARQGKNIDWTKLRGEDEVRRQEVHRMLDECEVRTAADYFHAALIYQHGQPPEDYLRAHALAVNSIILGNQNARCWPPRLS
jgi:hypothetical protein